jgi:flagellar basal body-associated protein FliL
VRKKKNTRTIVIVLVLAVALVAGLAALYWWMQADPRLQPGMSEKEVSRILGSEGTRVPFDRPPADLPYAKYYVYYDRGPDLFGNSRVVTVYYDRGGRLLKYEVSPLAPSHSSE